MKKLLLIIAVFIAATATRAGSDTLRLKGRLPDDRPRRNITLSLLKSETDSLSYTLRLVEENGGNTDFAVLKKILGKDTLFEMKDAAEGKKLLDNLSIDSLPQLMDSLRLNDTVLALLPVNRLLHQVVKADKRELQMQITDSAAETPELSFFKQYTWQLVSAALFLILIIVLAMKSNKSKPASGDVALKAHVKELLKLDSSTKLSPAVARSLDDYIESSEIEMAELRNTLRTYQEGVGQKQADLDNLQQQLNYLENLDAWDKVYREQALQKYIRPFKAYFDVQHPYPADAETRQQLTAALVNLCFQYMSYIRYRAGKADESDRYNLQALSGLPLPDQYRFNTHLDTTDVNPTPGRVPQLVQYITDILREAGITELKETNVQGYQIKP